MGNVRRGEVPSGEGTVLPQAIPGVCPVRAGHTLLRRGKVVIHAGIQLRRIYIQRAIVIPTERAERVNGGISCLDIPTGSAKACPKTVYGDVSIRSLRSLGLLDFLWNYSGKFYWFKPIKKPAKTPTVSFIFGSGKTHMSN